LWRSEATLSALRLFVRWLQKRDETIHGSSGWQAPFLRVVNAMFLVHPPAA